jgi:preprotein translocase subunit SecE
MGFAALNQQLVQTALLIIAVSSLFFFLPGGQALRPADRETVTTTAMVLVMVGITAVFFLIADQLMRLVVTLLLGIGS